MAREYGAENATRIRQRLDQLRDADSLEDLRHAPGNFHELAADRAGQWACSINRNLRMVFIPQENPIPRLPNGASNWSEIKGAVIIEIIDYH